LKESRGNEEEKCENEDVIAYVQIPCDSSECMQELTFTRTRNLHGDCLLDHLKSYYAGGASQVDLNLLENPTLGTDGCPPQVSEKALKEVAGKGNVEKFALVKPVESNKFNAVNMYLDEIGMLKRLPLNSRASDFAARAGFNPPPKFYGDVFIGRVAEKLYSRNIDFKLGIDTSPDASWLKNATAENLEHQTMMNKFSELDHHHPLQPPGSGEDGIEKEEKEGYSWTQTDDEIEVKLSFPTKATSKEIKVKFHSKSITVVYQGNEKLKIDLFARIDVDGCTWTLEKSPSEKKLVITCEKSEALSWPRITF